MSIVEKGLSLQTEYSEKGKTNNYLYGMGERISEEEEDVAADSDRHSTPPGTIGEIHDVMSENIESSLRKGVQKHGTVTAYHPKSLGPIFEDYGDQSVSNLSNRNEVGSKTTYMNGVGEGMRVTQKEPIELNDNPSYLIDYTSKYDEIYSEFKNQLILEFQKLHLDSHKELELNYSSNKKAVEETLSEGQLSIQMKEEMNQRWNKEKQRQKEVLNQVFKKKRETGLKKVAFYLLNYYR